MPSLAMEILTKCIHVYFQFDESDTEIPDVSSPISEGPGSTCTLLDTLTNLSART